MAQLSGAVQSDTQAKNAPAKNGLKRRANKEPAMSKEERTQNASKNVSPALEFDLPMSDDDNDDNDGVRPAKKSRTKKTKPPSKANPKKPTGKTTFQVPASPKGRKGNQTVKTKKKASPSKEEQATVASTRARRTAHIPKYIESSNESGKDDASIGSENEEMEEDQDNKEENAADSYPLNGDGIEGAEKPSQGEFESQILPKMIDREITDDDAESRAQNPVQTQRAHVQITMDDDSRPQQSQAKPDQPGEVTPEADAKDSSARRVQQSIQSAQNLPGNDDKTTPLSSEKLPAHSTSHKQVVAKFRVSEPKSLRQNITPQRNAKSVSETPIPPVSGKLSRTPQIIHFGPNGPTNLTAGSKSAKKRALTKEVVEGSEVVFPEEAAGDDGNMNADEEYAQEEPEYQSPDKQGPQDKPSDEDTNISTGTNESERRGVPSAAAKDEHMLEVKASVAPPESSVMHKSPEIEERRPRSLLAVIDFTDELSDPGDTAERDTRIQGANVQSVDANDESSNDKSLHSEALEYVEYEIKETCEATIMTPELNTSHNAETRSSRSKTPLHEDEEAPSCGHQKSEEPVTFQEPARQSIGVNAILDEEYPESQRLLNTQNLRLSHRRILIREPHGINDLPMQPPPLPHKPRRTERPSSAEVSDTAEAYELDSLSPSDRKPKTEAASNKARGLPVESKMAGTQEFSRGTGPTAERAPHPDQPSASNIRGQRSNYTAPLNLNMTATSIESSPAQPVARPRPRSTYLKAIEKAYPPRKSWPGAQVDKTTRAPQTVSKEPSRPKNPVLVRVKKRLTLPFAANDPFPEPDFPPSTPASFSTRLDLHASRAEDSAYDKHGSKSAEQAEAGQRLGNGSMTLVSGEDSDLQDDPGTRTRGRHRQKPESAEAISVAPSSPRPKTYAGEGDDRMVGVLTARESQRGLLDAIIDITNVSVMHAGLKRTNIGLGCHVPV